MGVYPLNVQKNKNILSFVKQVSKSFSWEASHKKQKNEMGHATRLHVYIHRNKIIYTHLNRYMHSNAVIYTPKYSQLVGVQPTYMGICITSSMYVVIYILNMTQLAGGQQTHTTKKYYTAGLVGR